MKHAILTHLSSLALGTLAFGMLLVPTLEAQAPSPDSRRGAALDRFDENGDGQLDREEFQELRNFMVGRRKARTGRRGPGSRRPALGSDRRFRGAPMPNLAEEKPPVAGADRKFRRRPGRRADGGPGAGPDKAQRPRRDRRPGRKVLLKRFDTNGDGRLDRQERTQMRAERKGRKRAGQQGQRGRRPAGPRQGKQGSGCSCKQNEV